MSRATRSSAVVGALALVLGALPASAAPRTAKRPRIAVAPLRVDGTVEEVGRTEIAAQLRAGLGQSAVDVLALDPRMSECTAPTCIAELARASDATHVVQADVVVDDKVYDVRIVAHDAVTNEIAAEVKETCEVCGVTEVADLVRRQSAALGERLASLAPTPAVLSVQSDPHGAAIALDDASVGSTPLRLELDAGAHRLRATKPGYAPIEHRMVAVEGVHETWSFALRLLAPPRKQQRMRAAGWVLLGIGSASIVPGVVFLALDRRPYRARCSGSNVDPQGDCRFLYGSVVHGAVLTAVGLALVATGIGLVVAARRKARDRARDDVARR